MSMASSPEPEMVPTGLRMNSSMIYRAKLKCCTVVATVEIRQKSELEYPDGKVAAKVTNGLNSR